VSEAIVFFWVVVGLLAVAAGCNHGWHHARASHLEARLARASYRDGEGAILLVEHARALDDVEPSPQG
jgi:hypothetical protein